MLQAKPCTRTHDLSHTDLELFFSGAEDEEVRRCSGGREAPLLAAGGCLALLLLAGPSGSQQRVNAAPRLSPSLLLLVGRLASLSVLLGAFADERSLEDGGGGLFGASGRGEGERERRREEGGGWSEGAETVASFSRQKAKGISLIVRAAAGNRGGRGRGWGWYIKH